MNKLAKTLAFALTLAAWCVTGEAQITNSVKISALPTGTTPTGAELIPADQSSATVTLTVNQINATPSAQINSGTNLLTSEIISNATLSAIVATNLATASNQIPTHTAQLSALNSATNAIITTVLSQQTEISALQTATNGLQAQVVTAASQITTLQGATNGLQSQIAVINTELGLATSNNSTASFTRLLLPAYVIPTIQVGNGGLTNVVDFSKGSMQVVAVGLGVTSTTLVFMPTNFSNGDNLFLRVVVTNGVGGSIGTVTNCTGGIVENWAGANQSGAVISQSLAGTANHEAMLNWTVFGNTLEYTSATR